jgi:hypothetical protein
LVIAGHPQLPHEWWKQARAGFELCTSQSVLQEAAGGDPEAAQERRVFLKAIVLVKSPRIRKFRSC